MLLAMVVTVCSFGKLLTGPGGQAQGGGAISCHVSGWHLKLMQSVVPLKSSVTFVVSLHYLGEAEL